MRFSTVGILAALAAIASAQNPFTRTSYDGISAGQPEDITWEATTGGTVTLVLMQGDPKALKQVQVIANGIINDGKYTWTPDPSLVSSDDYALKIVDDLNPNASPNYSTLFEIETAITESSSAASLSASATETETTTVASSTETVTTSSTSSDESSSATTTEVVTSTSTNTETTTTGTETSSAESTTMESSTRRSSTRVSSSATPSSTIVEGAAATGNARIGAGLVGFVGAAVLLL